LLYQLTKKGRAMADKQRSEVAAVATRALKDKDYAQAILRGEEDQPEVRNAILAELAQARDRALASLPADEARHLRTYVQEIDPARDPKIFDAFVDLRAPAGAFLVNLGADITAAPW